MIPLTRNGLHAIRAFRLNDFDVRQTIESPDDSSVLQVGGWTFTFYAARRGRRDILAITSSDRGHQTTCDWAMPIPPQVGRRDTPLETMSAICKEYGFEWEFGLDRSPMVVGVTFEGGESEFEKEVQRQGEQRGKDGWGGSCCFQVTDEGCEIKLFFVLDIPRIAADSKPAK